MEEPKYGSKSGSTPFTPFFGGSKPQGSVAAEFLNSI